MLSLKFLCVFQYDQGLLTHTPPGTGVPKQFLTMTIFKTWPKIQHIGVITGVSGINLTKLFHLSCSEAGMTISAQPLGASPPKFGRAIPLATKFVRLMFTRSKSTLGVLYIGQCSSGHVTLLRAEFEPPNLSPQSDLRRRAASRWALSQISSYNYVLLFFMPILLSLLSHCCWYFQ